MEDTMQPAARAEKPVDEPSRRELSFPKARAPKLLDTLEVEREYGLKAGYLNKMRCAGDGPPYLKLGKLVLYDRLDVDAWLATKRRLSTSDTGRAIEQDVLARSTRPVPVSKRLGERNPRSLARSTMPPGDRIPRQTKR